MAMCNDSKKEETETEPMEIIEWRKRTREIKSAD
jgi:hypothetical protein